MVEALATISVIVVLLGLVATGLITTRSHQGSRMYCQPIKFKKLDTMVDLPWRHTAGAGGFDVSSTEPAMLTPGEWRSLPTGLAVELPPGTFGLMVPRSSWFARGLYVCGTIDSDYRGELKVVVRNVSSEALYVRASERVAQLLVVQLYANLDAVEVDELSPTERGGDGFGSTGET